MPLFGGRRAMLEVQNQALIKTARERAERIDELERELQSAASQIGQLQRELQTAQLERDFYSKKASALEQENRELTECATKYSVHAQKLERELTEAATQHAQRAQKLERELTETATQYSLWGQKLERELNRIDPDGAASRRFGAKSEE